MTTETTALKRFVIPQAGVRVINPASGEPLPAQGAEVIGNAEYWVRRLNDGDVTQGREADARKKPATNLQAKESQP